MAEHGLSPDVKSYTLAMDICLRRGLWQVALKIVDRMKTTKVCLDAISYGKALHAANIGEQWEMAVGFLDEMVDGGWLPSHRSYTLVVEACRRAGEVQLADEVGRRWARDKERLSRNKRKDYHQHKGGGGNRPYGGGAPGRGGTHWTKGGNNRPATGPRYPFQPER